MIKKIALVAVSSGNRWFKVLAMDEHGNRNVIGQGATVDMALWEAATSVGIDLVLPISGPDTTL